MIHLRKTWKRVVISLFGGGALTELIHISTGDPNRPHEGSNLSLFYAVIIFIVLTLWVYWHYNKTLKE